MKYILIILVILVAKISILSAEIQFPFCFGSTGNDYGKDIRYDSQGNIYVSGYFQGTVDFDPSAASHILTAQGEVTNAGAVDIFVVKYDYDGNYLWSFSISSPGSDMPHSLYPTQDGFLLTGYFGGSADFDPSSTQQLLLNAGTGRDIFIAKYTSNGELIFAVRAGDTETPPLAADDDRYEDGMDICADIQGNIYAIGVYKSVIDLDPSAGLAQFTSVADSRDLYVVSLDQNGNYRWGFGLGASGQDHGHGIRVIDTTSIPLPEPSIISMGNEIQLQWTSIPHAIEYRIYSSDEPYGQNWNFVQSIQSTTVLIPVTQRHRFYRITAVLPESDRSGLVIITGFFSNIVDFDPSTNDFTLNSLGGWDIFLAAYNTDDGNLAWAKRMGGTGNDQVRPGGICIDSQDRILITGDFANSCDFDPEIGEAVKVSNGSGDIFVGIYNSDGQYMNAISIGGSSSDFAHRVTTDSNDNFIITGQFTSTTDFDPSSSTHYLIPNGLANGDVFVSKYSSAGDYLWANSFGGAITGTGSFQTGTGVSTDINDNIVATGRFYLNPDVDPSSVENNLSNNGACECFVVKYDSSGNLVHAPLTANNDVTQPTPMQLICYPNPFSQEVNFKSNINNNAGLIISIYDIRGQHVSTIKSDSNSTISWDGKNQNANTVANGVYLAVLMNSNRVTSTCKILKIK